MSDSNTSNPISNQSRPVYTCVPDGYLEPKIGSSGTAAWPAKSVIEIFKVRAEFN